MECSWFATDTRRKTRRTNARTRKKLSLRHVRGVATASARLLGVLESVRLDGRAEWKEDEDERRRLLATGEYSVENSMKEPGASAE